MADTEPATGLIGVLDMGASAIRLVVAEIDADATVRVIEEASRGVLLGRDTFSGGVIRSHTVDAALAALDGLPHDHGRLRRRRRSGRSPPARCARRATATCSSTGSSGAPGIAFEIINEAEESRLVYLAVRERCAEHRGVQGRLDAADRSRRRQHRA